jgi:hypothetical protein
VNAETFNSLHPVGTPVFAYPGARPEDIPSARRIVTRTSHKAQSVGLDRDGVVWVEDHGAYIALSHVDVVPESVWAAAKEAADLVAAVRAHGALPQPAAKPRWEQLRADLVAVFYRSMTVTGARTATDALDRLIVELGAPGLASDGAEAGR